jgi:hypothetical protein
VHALPGSWMLHYWLGFSYYFFKADYNRALEHLQRSLQLPGVHPNAAALVASLRAQQYGPETALKFLAEIAREADNEPMRQVARRQMREAQLAVDIERLNEAVAAYQATGTVGSSTGHRPLQVHRSKKGEAVLRGEVPE